MESKPGSGVTRGPATGTGLDLRAVVVLGQEKTGSSGRLLKLEALKDFEAGQVIGISIERDEAPRWYSIASAPEAPNCEVLYTKVDNGFLTPRLWNLKAGQKLWITAPRGSFTDTDSRGSRWWVANGTGIAPFASITARSLGKNAGENDTQIMKSRVLVHGCRTLEDAYFRDRFENAARLLGLTYILCISAEPAPASSKPTAAEIFEGRMTSWFKERWAKVQSPERVMLCGSSGMISDVREMLLSWDYPYERIETEVYF